MFSFISLFPFDEGPLKRRKEVEVCFNSISTAEIQSEKPWKALLDSAIRAKNKAPVKKKQTAAMQRGLGEVEKKRCTAIQSQFFVNMLIWKNVSK